MIKFNSQIFVLFFTLLTLAGCSGALVEHADSIAGPAGMRRAQIQTEPFLLTTYSKITNPDAPINVYVEGDGLAWKTPSEPSRNPTPHKALALALASRDPAANVIYIARPCQFTPLDLDPRCGVSYWTDRRFSEEVISSIDQSIDKLTRATAHPRLNLIGYSGGGAVVVLVAARRTDIISLRTVAGNLDHVEATRLHKASPMKGSLNAIDQAGKVARIPQLHFSGGKDTIISAEIAKRFLAASQPTTCVRIQNVPQASHEEGWIESWPVLLQEPVVCAAP